MCTPVRVVIITVITVFTIVAVVTKYFIIQWMMLSCSLPRMSCLKLVYSKAVYTRDEEKKRTRSTEANCEHKRMKSIVWLEQRQNDAIRYVFGIFFSLKNFVISDNISHSKLQQTCLYATYCCRYVLVKFACNLNMDAVSLNRSQSQLSLCV